MKIHLTYNCNLWRAGYTNIDRFQCDEHQTAGDVSNLDWVVDNGEATEIIAYDVIDHFFNQYVPGVVEHWISKLAPNGTLTIVSTDLYQLVNKIYNRQVSLRDANALIFGAGMDSQRVSTSTLMDISAMMRSFGLVIIEQRYEDNLYVVKGKRP